MRVLLATIQHTGTRFFANLLAPHFGKPVVFANDIPDQLDPATGFLVAHVQCRELIARYVAEANPVIVTTVRRMDLVRAGYARREILKDLPGYVADWLDLMEKYAPLVVSVDAWDRDALLANLSARIGVPLVTDWRPTIDWPE